MKECFNDNVYTVLGGSAAASFYDLARGEIILYIRYI